nr:hypothetical protein BaRGS_015922 [Batillaria attramentaria]
MDPLNENPGSEKLQEGLRPLSEPKDLRLRKYQEELAAPALRGANVIISAPTGSGKTRVALHIVLKHLEAAQEQDGRKRKVVFLARTVPLVQQQFKNFEEYLPSSIKPVMVTGEDMNSGNLHMLVPDYDVLVLTPKILENHLTWDKIPSLDVFSLIIFDECHHTRKGEPYNSVMKNYLKSKKAGERLPQGMDGQQSLAEAQELMQRQDEISRSIKQIICKIEELQDQSGARMLEPRAGTKALDPELEEIRKMLNKRPGDPKEQKYAQWAVALCKQAYSEALDVHDLSCPQDVLHYLRQKFDIQLSCKDKDGFTELERKLFEFFQDLEKKLVKAREGSNPNLQTLGRIIKAHLEEKREEDSRILVFVRTRATCKAVCRWLSSDAVSEKLRELNARTFTGAGAHQSMGGRSRKEGGKSILLAMPKIIMQERINRRREQYMLDAIEQICHMKEEEISRFVSEVQKETLETDAIDNFVRNSKKHLLKKEKFSLVCGRCRRVKVDGSWIRTINDAHRVIVGHKIDHMVTTHPEEKPKRLGEVELRGSVVCKGCKNHLGQLLYYKKNQFMTVGLKFWTLLDKDDVPSSCKRWKEVHYKIASLNEDDIKEHIEVPATEAAAAEEEDQDGAAGGDDI